MTSYGVAPKSLGKLPFHVTNHRFDGSEECPLKMTAQHLPRKLKADAILEALFEIRFSSNLPAEVVVGVVAGSSPFGNAKTVRLPGADIPHHIRSVEADLKYVPSIQIEPLAQEGKKFVIRVGPNAMSYHSLAPYPGWDIFKADLSKFTQWLFAAGVSPKVEGLGLRYVNALRQGLHGVSGMNDLRLKISFGDSGELDKFHINYEIDAKKLGTAIVNIAHPEKVAGPLPADTACFVDVDVKSLPAATPSTDEDVRAWLEEAHALEKKCFFSLLTQEKIEAMEKKDA